LGMDAFSGGTDNTPLSLPGDDQQVVHRIEDPRESVSSSGEHQLRSAAFPWGRVSAGGSGSTVSPLSDATGQTRCENACQPGHDRRLSSPRPTVKMSMVSLRQESFGKEEETRTLKPFAETLRVRIPPGKAGPAARSESCVAVGEPILRSVDSEVKGRVIEPRNYKPRGAFVVDTGGGRVRQLTHGPLSLPDTAGVEEHGQ